MYKFTLEKDMGNVVKVEAYECYISLQGKNYKLRPNGEIALSVFWFSK